MSDSAFQLGFRRAIAVISTGTGLALLGVALGLIYLDIRAHAALEHGVKLGMTEAEALEDWSNPTPILVALVCGSLGAALVGSGGLVALFELFCSRGKR